MTNIKNLRVQAKTQEDYDRLVEEYTLAGFDVEKRPNGEFIVHAIPRSAKAKAKKASTRLRDENAKKKPRTEQKPKDSTARI